ncbi:MAG: hypothetical protein Q7W45_09700 [Bacteroidota bacterium]|nr:hypothetical protein [Bacteroidota bacterium]MDP3144046.1 hypothetical protein [Bacteroidota bacterium]MDP3557458.1 hypothetical protein [Bacteroidota bacterium]
MENKTSFLEPLIERVEEYGKTSFELIKLKVIDKSAKISSTFLYRGIGLFVFGIFLVFANIGLALWLGDLLGKIYFGFLCVAGFYAFVLGALFFILNNWIKKQINNSIILQLLK